MTNRQVALILVVVIRYVCGNYGESFWDLAHEFYEWLEKGKRGRE